MYVECAACEKFSFFCLSDINEETQNRFKISDIHVVLTGRRYELPNVISLSILHFPIVFLSQGVSRISSDGDDRMEAKIKTEKKIPRLKINPK